MIKRLKTRIKRDGINVVATALGYRSPSTVYTWIRNGEIPDLAKTKVRNYLRNNKKKKAL